MSMPQRTSPPRLSPADQLRAAREIIGRESAALSVIAQALDERFCRAVELLFGCQGSVLTSGIGKAGLIAQKITATLASTGTRSHFLHPGEAVHGDLGRVGPDDVLLVFSQSGETEEVVRILPSLAALGARIIAITARRTSTLGRAASVTLELGSLEEAGMLGLAPSTSTTAMLALGDALALVVSQMRGFGREDFARFHPAGNLGRQLSKVEEHMRPLVECRLASETQSVREVFVAHSPSGRRTGAIMLVDGAGKLAGIFTDSDLARLFEHHRDGALDRPIREVMTARPTVVMAGTLMTAAVETMAARKISELPVLDAAGKPVGLIDITDVVSKFPEIRREGPADPPVARYPTLAVDTRPERGAPRRDCA